MGKKRRLAVNTISVCAGTKCVENNSKKLRKRLEALVQEHNLEDSVRIEKCECLKVCKNGPVVLVNPGGRRVENVRPKSARELLEAVTEITLH